MSAHDLRPQVVLHVGMSQSGAGMIQRGLARARGQLQARRVGYLGQTDIEALPHASGWLRSADADPAQVAPFERELAAAARSVQPSSAGPLGRSSVIISSDHFLGNALVGPRDDPMFRPRAEIVIAQALDALGADRARVVLYTQRQDRLMELSYLRAVQSGAHHSFEDQFPYRYQPVLDYGSLIDRLRAIPRVGAVVARPYELSLGDPRSFIDDFLAVVKLRGLIDLGQVTTAPPRLLSNQGLKLALALNPHLHTEDERVRARKFLLGSFSAADLMNTRFLPADERGKIVAAHAAVNRALFAGAMPDLPPGSYADDEQTSALGRFLPAYSDVSVWRKLASVRDPATLRIAVGAGRRHLHRGSRSR